LGAAGRYGWEEQRQRGEDQMSEERVRREPIVVTSPDRADRIGEPDRLEFARPAPAAPIDFFRLFVGRALAGPGPAAAPDASGGEREAGDGPGVGQ
jgi:hypothetical protein